MSKITVQSLYLHICQYLLIIQKSTQLKAVWPKPDNTTPVNRSTDARWKDPWQTGTIEQAQDNKDFE